jgi:hypothetical protein
MVREGIQKYIDEHNATLNEADVHGCAAANPVPGIKMYI